MVVAFGLQTTQWQECPGEIQGVEYIQSVPTSLFPPYYEVLYRYNVDGKSYDGSEGESVFHMKSHYSPGQTVKVYYNPKEYFMSVLTPGIDVGLALLGIFFSFIAYLVFMMKRKKFRYP